MSKRVLIIGYFYVDANMGGVRLRRIARLLPRHGWEPVVLTHPRAVGASPADHETARAVEVAAPDLARAYSWLRRGGRREPPAASADRGQPATVNNRLSGEINRWLMIPDKQIPWRGPALRRGRELLQTERFDAIFASIEPRTSALVAARLARETGVPCVLEYRDLWTGNPYYHITQPTAAHRWLHARLERGVLRQARRVSAVCRGIADYLAAAHGAALRAPVDLNYNFFDPEEYPADADRSPASRPFTVSYTGAMYARRTPHQFFEGMRLFADQAGLGPGQFRFRWAGGAAGIRDLGEVIDRTGVRPFLDCPGQIPHRDALRQMMESDAALIVQAPGDTIHIPGKLYEALGARVPVLALSDPCETAEIVTRCRAGIVCPHTKESTAAALAEFHRRHREGARWEFNETEVNRFSADAVVGRLAALLTAAGS